MELLIHINKRIKSRPLIQLPVETLLTQYQDPAATSFVINFTIIYIKTGFPRLPPTAQATLAPVMLSAMSDKPELHQNGLLLLLMPALRHVKDAATFQALPVKTRAMLAEFVLDTLLLPYGALVPSEDPAGGAATVPIPPGLSEYGFKRVSGETQPKSEEIEQTKIGLVKFLSLGVFPDAEIVSHLVVAAADTRFSVANSADMELKKIVGALDWRSPALVSPLLHLFLGTTLLRSNGKSQPVARRGKQEFRRKPANTRIRLKVMPYLLRARGPAVLFPDCVQVFFDCLYGAMTNARLKMMALQFSMLIIENASKESLTTVSTILCSGLMKLIADDGVEKELKILAYLAVGKLGSKLPHLVNKDLALLQTFFDALSQDDQNSRAAVREALLNMVDAFTLTPTRVESELQLSPLAVNPPKDFVPSERQPPAHSSDDSDQLTDKRARFADGVVGSLVGGRELDSRRQLVRQLLGTQVLSRESAARFVAVRYVATVFPADDQHGRYLLLLASGDSKDEVSGEALKALYGAPRRGPEAEDDEPAVTLPAFPAMAAAIAGRAEQRAAAPGKGKDAALPYTPAVYTEMLSYLRKCLWSSAGVRRWQTLAAHPCEFTPLLGRYLRALADSAELRAHVALASALLDAQPGVAALDCLAEAVGVAPETLAAVVVEKLPAVKSLLSSMKEDVRESSALLYGLLLAHGVAPPARSLALAELVKACAGKALESQHGAVLALGRALERRLAAVKAAGGDVADVEGYAEGTQAIVGQLSHAHALVAGAACTALGELARRAALPLDDQHKMALVTKLLALVDDVKMVAKVKERAAKALGLLCVGERFKYSREVIDNFLKMARDSKDVEIHLTAGEALACCVQGPRSTEARDAWTVLPSEHVAVETMELGADDQDLEYVLEQLLTKHAPDPHPNSRQASCIWLLALVKRCGERPAVRQRLEPLQRTFMDLLAENSDIVQDVASKGLALVYENSDEELRKRLVADLLDTLTSGRRVVAQVTSDTKLFEEGQLGTAPSGGNLSTYKELCSLASDLNQPDLIYKFMHLANHNAMWNSKKGAAFGFFSIAAAAGEQLAEHLPRIVPRLYRYQFDPTPKIQLSMTSIWHALVPETNKTIELYRREIFADLLSNLTASQWRVRTSCCLGLSDLLRGPSGAATLLDCSAQLPELWTQLFRVMDDVHEGTRTAAGNTARVLTKLCVRVADPTNGKAGDEMVRVILPVILQVGVINTVAEVRAVSLETMSQLVSTAGPLLRPHLPLLIPALLEATGELESRNLSQLSTQFGADARAQEVVDTFRASAAKSHYTTETVTKCLQYVDASVLEGLVPKVIDLMKSSVGLGTRVACSHLIILLVSHVKLELRPYASKLLSPLVSGLLDRNAAIRRQYAITVGYVCSVATDAGVQRLLTKLRTWYMEREDDSVRCAVAAALRAMGQHAGELLKDNAATVAPLAFFALHAAKPPGQQDNSGVEAWEEVWSEVTSGMESGIRQHISDICAQLQTALESPSWTMKAQAANSVCTVATKAGATLSTEHRQALAAILVAGLAGRTWAGKEHLLRAVATLATSCKEALKLEPELSGSMVEALLRECRKDAPAYKAHALRALGDVLQALDVDRFVEVHELVQATLDKDSADADDSDSDEPGGRSNETLLELKEAVYETLGKAWPSNADTQAVYRELLLERCTSCLATSTRPVQLAIVAALRCYLDKLCLLDVEPADASAEDEKALARILERVCQAVAFALGIAKHTRLRKEALNVLYLLAKKLKSSGRSDSLATLAATFEAALEAASKDNAPEIKSRVVDVKEVLRS